MEQLYLFKLLNSPATFIRVPVITLVQSPSAVINFASATTAATFSSAVTSGNRLVAVVTNEGVATTLGLSISDPTNGTWTQDFYQEALDDNFKRVGFFSVLNTGTIALTVTATASGGTPAAQQIKIYELNGVATSSYVENTDFRSVDEHGGSIACSLIITTPSCFALVGVLHYPELLTSDSGFTNEGIDQAWTYYHNVERKTSIAPGTYTINWNGDAATGTGAQAVIAYKPA